MSIVCMLLFSADPMIEIGQTGQVSPRFRPLWYKRGRISAPLFNPKYKDDCFFECLAFQSLGRSPSKAEVLSCRALVADVWLRLPALLETTATSERMSPEEYLKAIKGRMWGGQPEVRALELVLDLKVQIIRGHATPAMPDEDTCYIRLWNKHFTLVKESRDPAWRKITPFLRRRPSQFPPLWQRYADVDTQNPGTSKEKSEADTPPHSESASYPSSRDLAKCSLRLVYSNCVSPVDTGADKTVKDLVDASSTRGGSQQGSNVLDVQDNPFLASSMYARTLWRNVWIRTPLANRLPDVLDGLHSDDGRL
eukprot:129493-Amphidinium_carterae.2